jgi:uncharacterized protein YkwD
MRLAAVLAIAACGGSKPAPSTASDSTDTTEGASIEPGNEEPPPGETAPSTPAQTGLDASAQAFVDAHNAYRAKHCAPPLAWSAELAKVAQNWANELQRQGCAFEHSNQQTYGENLAGGSRGALDPKATVAMWYDEVKTYDFAGGGFSMETGHFTQVVWTTTTEVGCGWVTCKQMDIIVCNYNPPGNWEGQYKQHVLPTSCKK